jgi:hypothetical protein
LPAKIHDLDTTTRGTINLFIRNADGTLDSESSIIRYTLTDEQYCE